MTNYPLNHWMSWEGGVDLLGMTANGLAMPNAIIHVARMVHTPRGSCPAGMIFWQPDPAGAPALFGFVASDPAVGAYFGPTMFAGTPFEQAPVHQAVITIAIAADRATARVEVAGHLIETSLGNLAPQVLVDRAPGGMAPFRTQGVERPAGSGSLRIDGKDIALANLTGSLVSPTGVYGR
jgi:hypothetical protein